MRQLRWTIPALLLLTNSSPIHGQGCGPTRLKVSESVTLDMPAAKAWAMVGDFQDVSWDASTTGASGIGGNTPDKAKRMVTLKGGSTLEESLYKYDAKSMSYAYHLDHVDLTSLPIQNASATLDVVPDGDAKSIVRWKFVFYRNLAPGEGAPDEADNRAKQAVKHFMRDGLAGLKAEPKT